MGNLSKNKSFVQYLASPRLSCVVLACLLEVYNSFAGFRVQESKFDSAVTERRIWEMTYLDQDFRILYGRQESSASSEGFIFVMERETDNTYHAEGESHS